MHTNSAHFCLFLLSLAFAPFLAAQEVLISSAGSGVSNGGFESAFTSGSAS
jgi:hypothetical protein